ncbi:MULTISPECIES: TlpA family protein disulfide reductase [Rhodobacterales]|uniref:Thiol-disulfide isomerase/thioredoxin n=1 Tax=Allosediminivita pacifica TaxID=1267769 RepID=A0A2T6ADJ6_9RHOB|nr:MULTISPECIES: TlpA disulfide reductase family protein [Rhodobacterales]MAM38679.1 redoxin [Erythrobacter sp.]PTX41842.1 thiol-disulfide isomerase/thioredoxin [Allosediminivita pacifica]GGB25620.1 hypothetical protein GCM10011324_39360 [Allosediminivita pacifica]
MRHLLLAAATAFFSATAALAGGPQGFTVHDSPQEVPNFRFVTEDGTRHYLEEFRGRTILLNVWATWCPPCVEEMSTLDALEGALGGPEFEVVAVSIDRAGIPVVRRFFDEIAVENLDIYVDSTGLTATALRAFGLPATILISADGKEVGRLMGPAEWDTAEMISFIESHID